MALPLDCQEIVYRIIARKDWLDDAGNVKAEAFLVQRPEDATKGLSVYRACLCHVHECKTKLKSGHGVDSLHTGRIKDLELDVIQDNPTEQDHAAIVGLPPYFEKDTLPIQEVQRAEDLAGRLASMCRQQSRAKWRNG